MRQKASPELKRFPVQDPDALVRTLRPLPFRQRMATLRSLFNLSQEEASHAVNRKRNTWSNWEAEEDNERRATPGPSSRAALAYVFNLPQSLFVDE
jgi:DNA-binding XRE family transcriptional regulator